jgi:cell division initiation protein
MKLTPLDIRHKEFKRGMRGYTDVEVDEFLDEVADEYERIFKENIDLQERVESLEEKVTGYKRIEETLQKTLVNAQASAEEQKQNANKQAQLVLQDAELKARQLVNEAYSERQAIEQSMAKLRSAEEDFRFKFKQLLDGFLRQLQETPHVAGEPAAPTSDFSRHADAIKEAIARESGPERPAAAEPARRPVTPTRSVERDVPEMPAVPARPEPTAHVPDSPAVAPTRGSGGVQAGMRTDADTSVPRENAGQAQATAARPAPEEPASSTETLEPPAQDARRRERIDFAESDDLLADVDTGVNENEFKW